MASIALSVVGCIDYLAYGTIFTRVMFLPKKKGDVFFPARKATDERWGVVPALPAYENFSLFLLFLLKTPQPLHLGILVLAELEGSAP